MVHSIEREREGRCAVASDLYMLSERYSFTASIISNSLYGLTISSIHTCYHKGLIKGSTIAAHPLNPGMATRLSLDCRTRNRSCTRSTPPRFLNSTAEGESQNVRCRSFTSDRLHRWVPSQSCFGLGSQQQMC